MSSPPLRARWQRWQRQLRFALLARLIPPHPTQVAYYVRWPDGEDAAGIADPGYMQPYLALGDPGIGRRRPYPRTEGAR